MKGKKRIFSKKWRENLSKATRGLKKTAEHKKKIGLAHKGRKAPWVSERNRKHSGPKSYSWKGGISLMGERIRQTEEYQKWRKGIFKRDDYACQKCGAVGYIQAHHIMRFAKLLKKYNICTIKEAKNCKGLWNIDNGITLCLRCHKKTKNYSGKK